MNLPLTVLPPLWRNDRLAPLLSPYFLHLSFEAEIYLAIKGRHKEQLESLASSRSQRARAGPFDKGLWRRRGADGQGTTGKASRTKTRSHSRHYLCGVALFCECVRACVRAHPCPPQLPLIHLLSLPFLSHTCSVVRAHTHSLFLLGDANIARDKAPADSPQTKHFLF